MDQNQITSQLHLLPTKNHPNPTRLPRSFHVPFTTEEHSKLLQLRDIEKLSWKQVATYFPERTVPNLTNYYYNKLKAHKEPTFTMNNPALFLDRSNESRSELFVNGKNSMDGFRSVNNLASPLSDNDHITRDNAYEYMQYNSTQTTQTSGESTSNTGTFSQATTPESLNFKQKLPATSPKLRNAFDLLRPCRTTDRPIHKCNICSKTLSSAFKLQRHMSIHSASVNKLACTECKRVFTFPSELREHQLVHEAEKGGDCFRCLGPQCEKLYVSEGALFNHIRSEHDSPSVAGMFEVITRAEYNMLVEEKRVRKPFGCSFPGCSKRFNYKKSAKEHYESVHQSMAALGNQPAYRDETLSFTETVDEPQSDEESDSLFYPDNTEKSPQTEDDSRIALDPTSGTIAFEVGPDRVRFTIESAVFAERSAVLDLLFNTNGQSEYVEACGSVLAGLRSESFAIYVAVVGSGTSKIPACANAVDARDRLTEILEACTVAAWFQDWVFAESVAPCLEELSKYWGIVPAVEIVNCVFESFHGSQCTMVKEAVVGCFVEVDWKVLLPVLGDFNEEFLTGLFSVLIRERKGTKQF